MLRNKPQSKPSKAYWHIGANLKQCGALVIALETCVFISLGIRICQLQLSNEMTTRLSTMKWISGPKRIWFLVPACVVISAPVTTTRSGNFLAQIFHHWVHLSMKRESKLDTAKIHLRFDDVRQHGKFLNNHENFFLLLFPNFSLKLFLSKLQRTLENQLPERAA